MKNIPRIFVGNDVEAGIVLPTPCEVAHYLRRVMRRADFLAFGGGNEFDAHLSDDDRTIVIGEKTPHDDPSSDITLIFAPIKRTDDLINMATQMGVAKFQPVITARTVAAQINWDRMRKIATEAAEQSNRNSVPEILPPVKFSDLDLREIVFADERAAYGADLPHNAQGTCLMVGPEGGFSDEEFAALDAGGAHGISLGKTILRAELAAAVALSKVVA